MPKVSVAIITYNQREFIPETLQSVLEQDYDFEIIVVGDGLALNRGGRLLK